MDDLDRLLAQPLAEPADEGFSTRVLARVAHAGERKARLEGAAYGIAAAAVAAALALTPLGDAITGITPQIVASQPLAVAAAALALTFAGLQRLLRGGI